MSTQLRFIQAGLLVVSLSLYRERNSWIVMQFRDLRSASCCGVCNTFVKISPFWSLLALPCLGEIQYSWMAPEFICDVSDTTSGVRRVVQKPLGKCSLLSRHQHPTFKKSRQEKREVQGVNIVICPFSSHDKTVVHKSISKKHTNRYLRPTEPLGLRDGWRAAKYERTRCFPPHRSAGKSLMTSLWRTCLCMNQQVYTPGKPLVLIGFHQSL